MRQIEIDFFWPLTEQIALDLDYTECEKPKLAYDNIIANGSLTYTIMDPGSTCVSITTGNIHIDVDTTVIKVKEKPNLCRRVLYKCLGLKWEKK